MMMSLIDDILDNAKLDKKELNLNFSWFSVQDLFEEIIQIFEIQARGKGIELFHSLEHDYEIFTDRKRLK